jgi:hypothetical protein
VGNINKENAWGQQTEKVKSNTREKERYVYGKN